MIPKNSKAAQGAHNACSKIEIDPVLEAIAIGTLSDSLHMEHPQFSASALAAWRAEPANRLKVQSLNAIFQDQAQLMAAQARSVTILALLELMRNPDSKPETIRKAATEILRMPCGLREPAARPSKAKRGDEYIHSAEARKEGHGVESSDRREGSASTTPSPRPDSPLLSEDILSFLSKNLNMHEGADALRSLQGMSSMDHDARGAESFKAHVAPIDPGRSPGGGVRAALQHHQGRTSIAGSISRTASDSKIISG